MTRKKYNHLIYNEILLQIQFYPQNSNKALVQHRSAQQKVSRLDEANLETIYNLFNNIDELSPCT